MCVCVEVIKRLDVPKFTAQACIEIGHTILSRHFNVDKMSKWTPTHTQLGSSKQFDVFEPV